MRTFGFARGLRTSWFIVGIGHTFQNLRRGRPAAPDAKIKKQAGVRG
jgi:hypothetical protein